MNAFGGYGGGMEGGDSDDEDEEEEEHEHVHGEHCNHGHEGAGEEKPKNADLGDLDQEEEAAQ